MGMTSFKGRPEERNDKRRYQARGRFARPFGQKLIQLETLDEVEARLISAETSGAEVLEQLACGLPDVEGGVALGLPISIYCGG
jgi:hypothetical protein